MTEVRGFFHRKSTYLVGIPVLVVLAVVVGPFVYINFVQGDPPEKLSFSDVTTSSTARGSSASTTAPPVGVDGVWSVGGSSQVGYRVPEVLFGQSTEAVGRTGAVTGSVTIAGTTVSDATFTADLTKVTSDEGNRDRQFQGRIMDTASFPTATFTLTEPITLASLPANREEVTVKATGDLTLKGKTNAVTFDLTARRNGDTVEVNGSIPIHFADYGISNPSFGPASVGDDGELELLLVLTRAS
jgi:polyisoprenoid-binding protein YceI